MKSTRQAVLEMKSSLDSARIVRQDKALRQAAGQAFCFYYREAAGRASIE